MVKVSRKGRGWVKIVAPIVVAAVMVTLIIYSTHERGGGGTSLSSCTGDVAVIYVKGQDKLAGLMATYLSRQLGNIKVCLVRGEGLSLPAFPAVAVKGSALNIFSKILYKGAQPASLPGGWRLVRFDYVEPFAAQIAARYSPGAYPWYRYNATLVVIDGSTPFTRVNQSALSGLLRDPRYHALFSAIFVANITGYKVLRAGEVHGVQPRFLPAFYAESSYNLSKLSPSLREVKPGLYGADVNIAAMLAGSRVLEAFEFKGEVNTTGHPQLGSGRVHVAIFEDFACPVCAMFYRNVMPFLVELANNNTITLHFLDFIVHNTENVTRAHETLLCLYRKAGNSTLYYGLVSKIYSMLSVYSSEGARVNYLSWLGSFVENVTRRYGLENCSLSGDVERSIIQAVKLGIMGTPGFAVWSEGSREAIIFTGYHSLKFFREIIDFLAGG